MHAVLPVAVGAVVEGTPQVLAEGDHVVCEGGARRAVGKIPPEPEVAAPCSGVMTPNALRGRAPEPTGLQVTGEHVGGGPDLITRHARRRGKGRTTRTVVNCSAGPGAPLPCPGAKARFVSQTTPLPPTHTTHGHAY